MKAQNTQHFEEFQLIQNNPSAVSRLMKLFGKLHKVLDIAADKPAVLIRRKIYNRKVLRVRHCPFSAATSLSCSARTLLSVRFAALHWRSASFFIRLR